jgi:hypothetical protein
MMLIGRVQVPNINGAGAAMVWRDPVDTTSPHHEDHHHLETFLSSN